MKNNVNVAEKLKKKYHKTEPVTNFKDMIYRSAKLYGDRTAFKIKDENDKIGRITYSQFKDDIVYLGTALIRKGFLNKKIAVIGKNSYKWCVSYLAASIVGVVVPIDKELHTNDVTNFMNVSKSVCILGDKKNLEDLKSNLAKLNDKSTSFLNFEDDFDSFLNFGKKEYNNGFKDFDNIVIDPNELRILLFTSGTTGSAKGVCLSQNNICSNILSIYGIVKVRKSDLFFSILPLHHTYECTIGFLLPIYSGASICHCQGLRHITKNITEFKPSVILCVPLLLEKLYAVILRNLNKSLPDKFKAGKNENPYEKLPSFMKLIAKSKIKKALGGRMRVFIVGAASVNPNVAAGFRKLNLNVLQGYGLTECSPLVAGNTDFYQRDDAAGLPIPNVEYKIDSPNDEGVGEVIVKGPNVMLGYFEDEEKTNETIINGWFHTGDLGKINDDGYLFITGRCKSVIVTKNGKNIYPEEIEYYLNDNEFVSESLVQGIEKANDDETYVVAQIYPNIDAIKESLKKDNVSEKEIKDIISKVISEVNSKLPNYKHIKEFYIKKDEFEKTTTQKVKRYGKNML